MEVLRASLFGINVPREYWGEAIKSAAYLINWTPSSVLDFDTPQRKLLRLLSAPSLSNLEPRVFGCVVYVHIPRHQLSKLDLSARKVYLLVMLSFKRGTGVMIQ